MRTLVVSLALGAASLQAVTSFAAGSVKVDCWGDCSRMTVGQICDTYIFNSQPIAVACDETANPGFGTRLPCGNGGTCTPYGTLIRTDLLSAYCSDHWGNDAVVTCAINPVSLTGGRAAEHEQTKAQKDRNVR